MATNERGTEKVVRDAVLEQVGEELTALEEAGPLNKKQMKHASNIVTLLAALAILGSGAAEGAGLTDVVPWFGPEAANDDFRSIPTTNDGTWRFGPDN